MRRQLVIVAVALIAASSNGASAQRPKECSVDSTALARFAGQTVYRDCDVDRPAKFRSAPKLTMRLTDDKCLIATIEMIVDSTGLVDTSSAMVWETNSQPYADSVMKSLSRWRYSPAEVGKAKVRQVVRERRPFQMEILTRTSTVVTDMSGQVVSRSQPSMTRAAPRPLCK